MAWVACGAVVGAFEGELPPQALNSAAAVIAVISVRRRICMFLNNSLHKHLLGLAQLSLAETPETLPVYHTPTRFGRAMPIGFRRRLPNKTGLVSPYPREAAASLQRVIAALQASYQIRLIRFSLAFGRAERD